MLLPQQQIRREWYIRSLILMCVLVVALAGFIQAVHVHTDNSKLADHDCSLCSVVHSGIIYRAVVSPIPVFHRTVAILVVPETVSLSSGFVSSLRIRPPPAA